MEYFPCCIGAVNILCNSHRDPWDDILHPCFPARVERKNLRLREITTEDCRGRQWCDWTGPLESPTPESEFSIVAQPDWNLSFDFCSACVLRSIDHSPRGGLLNLTFRADSCACVHWLFLPLVPGMYGTFYISVFIFQMYAAFLFTDRNH